MHTRREFLVQSVGGAALLSTGFTLPRFLASTAQAAQRGRGERVLVVVQLSGGNDGLNTVIPYSDDAYHRARPTLRIKPENALKLDEHVALHPDMAGFKTLFDDGNLAVVNNVGYPNPDRSHFRAMDIWQSGCLSPENCRDGWLGRVVDKLTIADAKEHAAGQSAKASESGGDNDVQRPVALHLADTALPLALRSQRTPITSIRSIDALRLPAGAKEIEAATAKPRPRANDDLLFVQRVALASCASAKRIEKIAGVTSGANNYPDYGLAHRLRQIAQLIGADFGARIYYTALDGFDTHARQALAHGPLLRELADSIAAFYRDLRARGDDQRVVLMTFSEFGRRVAENSSMGTDHGAAAPLFVAGPACRAGVIGAPPNLSELVDGDVQFTADFRRIYADLLEKWLDVRHEAVLGERFDPLRVVRL